METITRKEAKTAGLPKYFTGMLCINGHKSQRTTSNGHCVQCTAEYQKLNNDASRLKAAKYLKNNRAAVNERRREADMEKRRAAGINARTKVLYASCVCSQCNIEFKLTTSELRRRISSNNGKTFCSIKCANSSNKKITIESYFRKYVRSAKNRGKFAGISVNYLVELWDRQGGKCPFSGVDLVLKTYKEKGPTAPYTASLDRIDSSRPYEEGNVRFVSTIANLAMNTWGEQELINFCKSVNSNLNRCNSGEVE
jgi:hypothetical protein